MFVARIAFSHLSARHIIAGLFLLLRERRWHCADKIAILSVIICLATIRFASGSMHWDHRSASEFVICILLAFAAAELLGAGHTEWHATERRHPNFGISQRQAISPPFAVDNSHPSQIGEPTL